MLPTGSTSKVLPSNEDFTAVGKIIEHKISFRLVLFIVTPIPEEIVAEAFFRRRLQKTSGDNLVCINILNRQRNAC